MLFGPEAKEKFERESKGIDDDTLTKDYETVNEGDTTDTTEAFDNESLLARTDKQVKEEKKKAKKAVEEGIKSSSDGEEGDEAADVEVKEQETKRMTFTEEVMEEQKDEV